MNLKKIAVFCGSGDGSDPEFLRVANNLGAFLAKENIQLIYGGAKIGLMGAVANAALENNGRVIGVIPNFLKTKEVAHDALSELITVKTMHERKTKMSELADGFIVLPGGFGTMEEFFEILTWAQLGLHQKPIGILNVNGYYDKLIDFFQVMRSQNLIQDANLQMVLTSDAMDELLNSMMNYTAPKVKNWLEAGRT